jgi:type IV pilus assembly protein PilW
MRINSKQLGLSLVELMVAMVIGVASMLVLMQVGIVAESQKRTTIGGGSAVDSTAVALGMLRRDLKLAGFSLNHPDVIGCQLTAYREAGSTTITTRLWPADITQQTALGGSDTLNIRAGNTRRFSEADLFSNHPGDSTPFITGGNYGFIAGDVFLIVESGVAQCVMAEVSGAPPDNTQVLHASGSRFNNPAGPGVAFTGAARLTNLGPDPTLVRYSVNAGNLQRQELLGNVTDIVLSGVTTFQTQYGFNVTGAGLTWSDTVLDADGNGVVGNARDWQLLSAIRVAVVIRNDKYEKPNSSGVCDTSPASVAWSFGSFDVSELPDGRCYRYGVAETIVPLRNLIWSPT